MLEPSGNGGSHSCNETWHKLLRHLRHPPHGLLPQASRCDVFRSRIHNQDQAPSLLSTRAPRIRSWQHASHRSCRHQRSEEHTSELQSLMRISYAAFCLKKQITHTTKM